MITTIGVKDVPGSLIFPSAYTESIIRYTNHLEDSRLLEQGFSLPLFQLSLDFFESISVAWNQSISRSQINYL